MGESGPRRPDPGRVETRADFNFELRELHRVKGLSIRVLAGRCGYSHGSVGNFLNPKVCALPENEEKARRLFGAMGATEAETDEFLKAMLRIKEAIEDEEPAVPLPSEDERAPLAWRPVVIGAGVVVALAAIMWLTAAAPVRPVPAALTFTGERLLVAQDGRCVRSEGGSTAYDVRLVLADCAEPTGLRWRFVKAGEHDHRLVNDHGRCLGAHDAQTAYQGTKEERVECQSQGHFFWRVTMQETELGEQRVTLFNVGRKGCLQTRDDSVVGLSPICDQRSSQTFTARPA